MAHCNDGNVLLVPQAEVETQMKPLALNVDRIGRDLKLSFPQKMEYQVIEPDSSWAKSDGSKD